MSIDSESRFVPAGPRKHEGLHTYREGDMIPPSSQQRAAHALEFIATQLAEINVKLGKLIEAAPPKPPSQA